ncbi:MAG: hypothetical protein ACQESE_01480 [Nanobdellota archaeon]
MVNNNKVLSENDFDDKTTTSEVSSEYAAKAEEKINNLKNKKVEGISPVTEGEGKSIDTLIRKMEELDKPEVKGFFNKFLNTLEKGYAAFTGNEYFETKTGKELQKTRTELTKYITLADQKIDETESIISDHEEAHSAYTIEINSTLNQYKDSRKQVEEKEKLIQAMENNISENPDNDTFEVKMEIENMKSDLDFKRDDLDDLEGNLNALRYDKDSSAYELQDLRRAKQILQYSSKLAGLTNKRINTYLKQEKTTSPYTVISKGEHIDQSSYEAQKMKIGVDSKRKQYRNQIREKLPSSSEKRQHLRDLRKNSPHMRG